MPLFEVQPVAWDVPPVREYDALIFSSGNAVRNAGEGLKRLRDLPILAVGAATAKAAEDAGLQIAFIGQTNVEALIAEARKADHHRLLWLAGEDRTIISEPEGVSLDIRVVYKSAALSAPPNFDTAVSDADVVLLHSPRAAIHFLKLCDNHGLDRSLIAIAALSLQIAESAGSGWKRMMVAAVPNDASLLSEVQSCFTNGDCDP